MKRLILVSAMFFVGLSSYAYASDEKGAKDKEAKDTKKEEVRSEDPGTLLQVTVGPMIDIKNWGDNQFSIGAAFGGKHMRLGLGYARAGAMNSYRPYLLLDLPFTFHFGSQSSESFVLKWKTV